MAASLSTSRDRLRAVRLIAKIAALILVLLIAAYFVFMAALRHRNQKDYIEPMKRAVDKEGYSQEHYDDDGNYLYFYQKQAELAGIKGRILLNIADDNERCGSIRFEADEPVVIDGREKEMNASITIRAYWFKDGYHIGFSEPGYSFGIRTDINGEPADPDSFKEMDYRDREFYYAAKDKYAEILQELDKEYKRLLEY